MTQPEQELYEFPRNVVLTASAGTGKTHALVGVVLHLLIGRRKPVDPARIVATTFSRKAAAEIRARIVTELERLASLPATSSYSPSLRARGLEDRTIVARATRALSRLSSARIGTLHSFATGILRAYAIELGLGPGFDLATEADSRLRVEDAVARAIERRLAVDARGVLAMTEAAGGIDRLVLQVRRALGRLEEDGRSSRDLVISAGDVAAVEKTFEELRSHARALVAVPRFADVARAFLDARAPEDVELTAAALCGVAATGKKTPEVEAFAVFRRGLVGLTNDERGRRLARTFLARDTLDVSSRLVRDLLVEVEEDVERVGRARGSLGFGEILRAARDVLRDRPDVAAEVGAGIDALLVDEFQDTSRLQRDFVQLLWARPDRRAVGVVPTPADLRGEGLLVVGDRKQSIYGFRGADVAVFAELAVGLAGKVAREALGIPAGLAYEPRDPIADFRVLRHNRRSPAEVLAFANAFSALRFLPGEPPPELFEIDYVPHTEDLLVPPEQPARAMGEPRAKWLKVVPKGNASTRLEEALVIADQIRRVVAAGAPRLGRDARRPAYRDIAVLATTNGMLDAAAFALAQAEIPYVVAGKGFFRTREIRDLAAMLALVLDPSDRLAALAVLRGPWTGLHDESLLALVRPGEGLMAPSSWTAAASTLARDEDRASLRETASVVEELARCSGRLGPGTILREAARGLGFIEVLRALPRGEQRAANVEKLLVIADRQADARAFRAWLDEASELELSESEAATFAPEDDAVRLLTVHASKGLDFPITFVPEIGAAAARVEKGVVRITLGSGSTPSALSVRVADPGGLVLEAPSFARAFADDRRRDRAERQRLAYVAITRAADALVFVGGRARDGASNARASTLDVLEVMAEGSSPFLTVETVEVPPPAVPAVTDGPLERASSVPVRARRPSWRTLPIAPTALADFAHCARRFELVHVLGMPEHARGAHAGAERPAGFLDARAQGTIAHAVLERVPATTFGTDGAESEVSAALSTQGVPVDHPQHVAITARVARFLTGAYAREIASRAATVRREVPFVLHVGDADARAVALRGSMDLVVEWRDGSVDVVDYKSARAGTPIEAYAFQLDVYRLALRALYPQAPALRAGIVFLGGGAAEPVWRTSRDDADLRAHLATLAEQLVDARWSESFPRAALERCEAIHCGFIGRCHADVSSAGTGSGTQANASRVTIT